MRRMRKRRKRTQEEIEDMKEELRIAGCILFWILRAIAVFLLLRYLYDTYKPPVTLVPNDWDLPVVITEVK